MERQRNPGDLAVRSCAAISPSSNILQKILCGRADRRAGRGLGSDAMPEIERVMAGDVKRN